jgi:hypothetical protein
MRRLWRVEAQSLAEEAVSRGMCIGDVLVAQGDANAELFNQDGRLVWLNEGTLVGVSKDPNRSWHS